MSKTACHIYFSVLLALADEVGKGDKLPRRIIFPLPSVKILSQLFCQSLFPASRVSPMLEQFSESEVTAVFNGILFSEGGFYCSQKALDSGHTGPGNLLG